MADIDWDTVVAVAADMATGVPVLFQTLILAHVNLVVNPEAFGGEDSPTYTLARAYLAAHYGAMRKGQTGGAKGNISSQSEGGVSQSFSTPPVFSNTSLAETGYGRAYASLVRQSAVANAGFVTG